MSYQGVDGQKEYKKALELYTQAVLQGNSTAQTNVGMMYTTGTGTFIDRAKGYAWYSLAASQGNTTAQIYRNDLMADMTWEELNQAQAIPISLYNEIEKINFPETQKKP